MLPANRVKPFIRNVLCCQCPEEVFHHVEQEDDLPLASDLLVHHRLDIGHRLLVYVMRNVRAETIRKNLGRVLEHGRQERDAKGFNRLRIVLTGDDPLSQMSTLMEVFHQHDASDERVHLHILPDHMVQL